jgi:hypothetical protein
MFQHVNTTSLHYLEDKTRKSRWMKKFKKLKMELLLQRRLERKNHISW